MFLWNYCSSLVGWDFKKFFLQNYCLRCALIANRNITLQRNVTVRSSESHRNGLFLKIVPENGVTKILLASCVIEKIFFFCYFCQKTSGIIKNNIGKRKKEWGSFKARFYYTRRLQAKENSPSHSKPNKS